MHLLYKNNKKAPASLDEGAEWRQFINFKKPNQFFF